MKLIKRENDEIIIIKEINIIDDLDDDNLILLEKGDRIKKIAKGARTMFCNKNIASVKSIKEAIKNNIEKQNKKNKSNGHFCCVCGDWFENRMLNEKSICHYCSIN